MTTNLLDKRWLALDPRDLRDVLDARAGGPGQHRGKPNEFFIPLYASAKLILRYRKGRLLSIHPGVAFSDDFWTDTAAELDALLGGQQIRYSRQFSFSSYRVSDTWVGANSGVSIHPPLEGTPITSIEMADHPFILEFPMAWSPTFRQNVMRRTRRHRSLTSVLNILLAGYTSFLHPQTVHFWGISHEEIPQPIPRWVQHFFDGPLGDIYLDCPTTSVTTMPTIPAGSYQAEMGHDGRHLSVPDDLDDCMVAYSALERSRREKFDRAAFWFDQAHRQWYNSTSMSYASLVSSVESLLTQGAKHEVHCPQCQTTRSHDYPGATEQFRGFFERYAPGKANRGRRSEMYHLRSQILHGSFLTHSDQFASFGWDPPVFEERSLHEDLWSLTRTALRNWLKASAVDIPSSRPTTA